MAAAPGISCRVGDRRSFDGALCTVSGLYLGLSNAPTAGSFVRPARPADKPRGFLEAVRHKYASETEGERAREGQDVIEFSGKIVEEVGFDKIRQRLAELQQLKIVLLDGLQLAGLLADAAAGPDAVEQECLRVRETCPRITELDLSRNLLGSWADVWHICKQLDHLKLLKLDGNRFGQPKAGAVFDRIAELHLNGTLLAWDEIAALTFQFPDLATLSASFNQVQCISAPLSASITRLTLENNELEALSAAKALASLPRLEHVSFKGNCISAVYETARDGGGGGGGGGIRFSQTLKSVDLSYNRIDSWEFVNELPRVFPGLEILRTSGNPLYNQAVAPSSVTGLPESPMTVDEAYMLTLSRLARLQVLNYSKITAAERSNAELYYLSLIGRELSATAQSAEPSILARHPRYSELCDRYSEPTVSRPDAGAGHLAANPRTVAARLVQLSFYLSDSTQAAAVQLPPDQHRPGPVLHHVPRSLDTYQVKAIVARQFGLAPYSFRLIWETDEWDPAVAEHGRRAEEGGGENEEADWDSSDDESWGESAGAAAASEGTASATGLVRRQVELVDSTRDIGFWFEDVRAGRIRVDAL